MDVWNVLMLYLMLYLNLFQDRVSGSFSSGKEDYIKKKIDQIKYT